MRINRLDLIRYGIFTDYSISFGERVTEGPDLHIIYGPNEAGKSTALAAFLDLLFGIEPRSRYGFLHPYSTMRIGGEIETNGASRQFARIKRPQSSLLDSAGNPIADSAILGELGGIDRASYTTMFSLDDDTLEAGGESILASKGDLGQLLFSASAGLSDFSQKLVDLKAEADGFYKFRGRGGELSELKTRLADLKKKRDDIDTMASEYAKLIERRDLAAGQYNDAIAERGRIQSRLDELRRQLGALPRRVALRALRERINPLAEIPEAPIGWLEELPKLQKAEVELTTRAKGIETEISKISGELDGIIIDDRILALAERIDLLTDLRARFVTADKDIPERRLQQRDIDVAIGRILARMECDPNTDARSLVLGASVTGALRELMERRSGVEADAETAAEELKEAQRRLAEAQSKLEEVGGETRIEVSSTMLQLATAVSLARTDDHAARRRLARREHQAQLDALKERMRALVPWKGEAEALRNIFVPGAEDVERWKSSISEAEKRIERYDHEIERLLTDQRRLTAEITAASQVIGVLSDQQAADIRASREEAWANHKHTLDAASAGVFEASLRRDDIVTNSRIGNAGEVAHLNEVSKTLTTVNADLDAARDSGRKAADDLQDIRAQIAAAIRTIAPSLPLNWSPTKLESWLGSRDKVLEALVAAEKAEREEREAEEDGESVRCKLIDAVSAAGIKCVVDASTEALITLAQTAIDQEAELRAIRTEVDNRCRELEARERKAQKAKDTERKWDDSWAALCMTCWLGTDRSIPTVPTIREILKALDELGPLIERRASLTDRIQKMESDQHRFVVEIESLATELETEITPIPLDFGIQIARVLENARAAENVRKAASARLGEVEARRQAIAEEKEIHDSLKAEMINHFMVESLDEVDEKLRNLARRWDLQEQVGTAEQEILVALGVPSIGLAEETLDKMDRSAVETEIAQLQGRFEDQDKRSRELFSEHNKASDCVEAVGGDDAVAKIEECRRTTLLEIEEGARRYLRLRLGVTAAEQALRIYRDQHRSSMMARASDAFKVISRDAYKGLTTQPDRDSETLVAVGANDGSKVASDLSKGTRFQLYLALRVAGYQEFVQSRRPVPFVADDIMETFDDFRAEEAFKLFTEMAKVGQVIYLTHHRHLCEIARRACPGVQIHDLAAD